MSNTDVLIIGAGPTGLALACQLIRYDVDFVIIDKKETTTPHSKAIGVQARTPEGKTETVEAKYLVACDGAKSLVRHGLGLEFAGSTFERMFYVADVQLNWEYPHDGLQVFLMKSSLLAFFPMTGDNQYRIVGT